MAAQPFSIDAAVSTVLVRTRAKGLLARLAHDLEIAASGVRGTAQVDDAAWSGELEVPIAGLEVVGVVRGGQVDRAVLSPADRLEIERKIREEVLTGTPAVKIRASGPSRDRGEANVELARGSARVPAAPIVREEAGKLLVSGAARLSLKALGVKPIKGPLGAFEVSDAVEVRFALTLVPAG